MLMRFAALARSLPAFIFLVAVCCLQISTLCARADDLESLSEQLAKLEKEGNAEEAISVAGRLATLAEQRFGPTDDRLGLALQWLGRLQAGQGQYGEALPNLRRAVEILKARRQDDPERLQAQYNLSVALRKEGENEEAISIGEQTLAVQKSMLPESEWDAAQTAHNLGWAYYYAGRYDQAIETFQYTMATKLRHVAPEHDDIGWLNDGIGQALAAQEKYSEAESYLRKALSFFERYYGEDSLDTAQPLHRLGNALRHQNKFSAAEPLLNRALAIKERELGSDHIEVAYTLNELGWIMTATLRLHEAERYLQRALKIKEQFYGPDSLQIAWALDALFRVYVHRTDYDQAEKVARRAHEIKMKVYAANDLQLVQGVDQVAIVLYRAGRVSEAATMLEDVLKGLQNADNPDSYVLSVQISLLATINYDKGDLGEAERQVNQSLALLKEAGKPEDASKYALHQLRAKIYTMTGRYKEGIAEAQIIIDDFGKVESVQARDLLDAFNTQSIAYASQDRYSDSELVLKKAIALAERTFGENSVDVAQVIENLGVLYTTVDRHHDARAMLDRALTIRQAVLAPDHPLLGSAYATRANLLNDLSSYAQAEADAREALRIFAAKYGPTYPMSIVTRDVLATALREQNKADEAIAVLRETIALVQGSNADSPERRSLLWHNLGLALARKGENAQAVAAYETAIRAREQAEIPDEVSIAQTRSVLGSAYERMGRWREAVENFRRAHAAFVAAVARASGDRHQYEGRIWLSGNARDLLKALWGQTKNADPAETESYTAEAFELAQYLIRSDASSAVAQAAARKATGDSALATSVRERQDLYRRWRQVDTKLTTLLQEPIQKRDKVLVAGLKKEAANLDDGLQRVDKLLANQFPQYTSLAAPKPIDLASVRDLIEDDEAVVQILVLNDVTFVWVVTKSGTRWFGADLGVKAVNAAVAGLRCGLDRSNWIDASSWPEETPAQGYRKKQQLARLEQCKAMLPAPPTARSPLPFDLESAHALYKGLFADAGDLIASKRLLIVASGALTSLPFQVLVTKSAGVRVPEHLADYRDVAWLARDHTLTVLPSVSSLGALRRHAKASAAPEPFLGYGNPVLTGQPGCQKVVVPDTCPDVESHVAETQNPFQRLADALVALPNYFRDGLADVATVRKLCPLPDTAHELKCVARSLGVADSSVVLGSDATETAVKRAPLARYRVVHFATHGLLAGETAKLAKARAEPALVLSPPEVPTEDDDGLLTASEVAGLKLDADWVVMSACNTASGSTPGAEALSGLSRAFFYAGARALLVSHWPVNSYAATMLTSTTFAEMRKEPGLGRAEAFRRAMLTLVGDKQRPWGAHPSVWAPFVVVGEGGAAASPGAAH